MSETKPPKDWRDEQRLNSAHARLSAAIASTSPKVQITPTLAQVLLEIIEQARWTEHGHNSGRSI